MPAPELSGRAGVGLPRSRRANGTGDPTNDEEVRAEALWGDALLSGEGAKTAFTKTVYGSVALRALPERCGSKVEDDGDP